MRGPPRVRFAPSPTGTLHLGGLRTALFNRLHADSSPGGKCFLRIEDTDAARTVPSCLESIPRSLERCGVTFDRFDPLGADSHAGPRSGPLAEVIRDWESGSLGALPPKEERIACSDAADLNTADLDTADLDTADRNAADRNAADFLDAAQVEDDIARAGRKPRVAYGSASAPARNEARDRSVGGRADGAGGSAARAVRAAIAGLKSRGAVVQSSRLPLYAATAEALQAEGRAYPCFCSQELVATMPRGYDGRCGSIPRAEAEARVAAGEPHVVRLRAPRPGASVSAAIDDTVRGRVPFRPSAVDDAVLLKGDGRPTYHLAACVDDLAMGITDVIRGEEWLPSAPKHTAVHRALLGLGETEDPVAAGAPRFAHLPLLHAARGQKLSKRRGARAVEEELADGFLPEALVNFVALLGWTPPLDRGEEAGRDGALAPEVLTRTELSRLFSLGSVNKAASIVDRDRLTWLNGQHIRILAGDVHGTGMASLVSRLRAALPDKLAAAADTRGGDAYLAAVIDTVKERVHTVESIASFCAYFFEDPDLSSEPCAEWRAKNWDSAKDEPLRLAVLAALRDVAPENFSTAAITAAVKAAAKGSGVPLKRAFAATRHVVTGSTVGAGVPATLVVLGRDTTLARLAVVPESQ